MLLIKMGIDQVKMDEHVDSSAHKLDFNQQSAELLEREDREFVGRNMDFLGQSARMPQRTAV